jgi:hypothetical protein
MPGKDLRYLFAILLGASMLLGGCRSGKIVTEPEKPAEEDSNMRLISMLEQRTHRFSTIKIKRAEVELYINGVQETIRGNIAIYRDSMIAVSVIPALGYEFLRIMCTRDSVIIINRPEKSYYASSFEYYRKKYGIPVDFHDLQALLANEVFYYKDDYGDRVFERQLRTRNDNNLFIVDSFRDGSRITNQGIEIDREGRRLENVFIVDYDTKMRLNIDYQEFTGDDDLFFPKRLKIDLFESNNTIKMEITYGQIVFNDSLNVEFSVPEHYTRGDM